MALCLAESLIEKRGFDPIDQLERYTRWKEDGHLASNGRAFDIGNTVRAALATFAKTHNPYSGSSDPSSTGNGSLMRLVPVPLFYFEKPREAIERSGESSRTTHGTATAVDACRYFGGLIVGAIMGASKKELLSDYYSPVQECWRNNRLVKEIDEIATGSFKTRHFINDGHTIKVEQQVEKDAPLVAKYLKSDAAYREIDLHSAIAEFLRQCATGKSGLLFRTRRNTPHLYANLEDRWLTPRLIRMRLEEEGMGWHSFRRFRKTWLRGRRCLEDINNFWMAHKPETMSEIYSHLHEELKLRLEEAERVEYGFDLPKAVVAPNAPKKRAVKS
jgi:hypothetical protein